MALSIYQLKGQFQQLLSPLLAGLIRYKISPNQITLFTLFLGLFFGLGLISFSTNRWLWAAFPLFMLLRMALNAVDGMLANQTNQKTKLGSVLNEMCDHVSDIVLYLPFAFIASINVPLIVTIIIATLLAEIAGLMAIVLGAQRCFDGPMGKSDRAFSFSIAAICITLKIEPIWVNGLLALILVLLLLTIYNRLKQALR